MHDHIDPDDRLLDPDEMAPVQRLPGTDTDGVRIAVPAAIDSRPVGNDARLASDSDRVPWPSGRDRPSEYQEVVIDAAGAARVIDAHLTA
ncbi:MAG: hypothetical protein ABEK12_00370, partial [Candidatus Nanohaloarchaea archaeon]